MNITFIRHFKTKGNMEKRYIGRTDEPLAETSILPATVQYPQIDIVYSSPLLRCIQTANLIYEKAELVIVDKLSELNFGDFEGKNYEELKDNIDYISFIDSNGTGSIPNGENTIDFKNRCCEGFLQIIDDLIVKGNDCAVIVCHGGTIMSILQRFNSKKVDFYSYMAKNGSGYETEFDVVNKVFTKIEELGESK